MYSGPIKNHINANGFCLTPAILEKAIVLAGMTWGMPPAQVFATMTWPLMTLAEITVSNEDNIRVTAPTIFMGLPIEIDKSLPSGTVQLRYQGAVLFEIQCLAVPMGFEEAA